MSELCVVPGCIYARDGKRLACHRHWALLPAELRQELARLDRRAPGTPTHVRLWRETTQRLTNMAPVDGGVSR